MSNINRADLLQDVYRPRGGSLGQWANLRLGGEDNPHGVADEYTAIWQDLMNHAAHESE